jgi:hypothetical protein
MPPSWLALPAAAALVTLVSAALLTALTGGEHIEARADIARERIVERAERWAGAFEQLRATAGQEAAARFESVNARLEEYRRWRERRRAEPPPTGELGAAPGGSRHIAESFRTCGGHGA